MWALLWACAGTAPAPPVPAEEEPETEDSPVGETASPEEDPPYVAPFHGQEADAPALLRRMSLDLRGVLPSIEELEAVEADPAALEGIADAYLEDARYEDRLVELLAERWLTQADDFNVRSWELGYAPEEDFTYLRAVGEEPLRLMAYVGSRDMDWTEVVTADYTVATDILTEFWPLEFLEEEAGAAPDSWRRARYTDGRPAGGVAMSNGLWWRYYTTPNNYNRSRAAALSRLFLCEDFLLRPIAFEAVALLDRESLNEAIRTVPACVGCHSTLDPLAATLFGFWWFDIYAADELSIYHPEREYLGEYYLETEMAWFGQPMDSPAELGGMIAADPRFLRCTATQMAEVLWRRQVDVEDFSAISGLVEDFEAGDRRLDALVRAILASPDYRVGALGPEATSEDAERLSTRRLMSPQQLESVVADLTGFTWRYGGYDQLTNDVIGYRVLAGGMDGVYVTHPGRDPNVTQYLVARRLAAAAAQVVVESDLRPGATERRLFGDIDPEAHRPGDPEFEAELVHLHRRILGSTPDEEQKAILTEHWQAVEEHADHQNAWMSVVTVLLSDPAFWTY